ncbi:MAG: MoaD/ThiS family protein [Proteobacteria bacterium]|nr:MoaD/ThiS family protein [Pseudomonadota bacterium]
MNVRVRFMGSQRVLTGSDQIDLTLTRGARVAEAVQRVVGSYPGLGLAEGSVVVAVNDRISGLDGVLEADDTVSFLPFIGGG